MDLFSELARFLFLTIVLGVNYSTQAVYPYGPSFGDAQLPTDYGIASTGLPLRVPIKFYNDTYDTIFVS